MSNPLVSICIPTYNYANYLPQAISSCLAQSYAPIEIIIVDDASTDNTRQIVRSFNSRLIRYFENPVRLGLAGNWNRAFSQVRGEIVKWVCADDYLAENALEPIVAAFGNPGVHLVFCSANVINGEGKYVYTHQPYSESQQLAGGETIKRCLKEGNLIGGPTSVAVRTSALRKVGDFNDRLIFYLDLEMWIRILLTGDAYFLSQSLVSVRQHEGSETKRLERAKQIDGDKLGFLTGCLEHPEIRRLLSESEAGELTERVNALLNGEAGSDVSRRSLLEKYKTLARKTVNDWPYLKKLIHPVYKKLKN